MKPHILLSAYNGWSIATY